VLITVTPDTTQMERSVNHVMTPSDVTNAHSTTQLNVTSVILHMFLSTVSVRINAHLTNGPSMVSVNHVLMTVLSVPTPVIVISVTHPRSSLTRNVLITAQMELSMSTVNVLNVPTRSVNLANQLT